MDEGSISAQDLAQIIDDGADAWNNWYADHPEHEISLKGVDFSGSDLRGADFSKVTFEDSDFRDANLQDVEFRRADLTNTNFSGADLSGARLDQATLYKAVFHGADLTRAFLQDANLRRANLYEADLRGVTAVKADFTDANLRRANLSEARLMGATFEWADLNGADLSKAVLVGADLSCAHLVETDLSGADVSGCSLYGVSAWNVKLHETHQCDLTITRQSEPIVTVDNVEVAQFLYLLLNNKKIHDLIDPITGKIVLILGRFAQHNKRVLDSIRNELRLRDRLPVMFDFNKPEGRDLTETVSLLAHMARYIIVDLSNPRSAPQELQRVVEGLPSVPVQPLIHFSEAEYGMFEHFKRYPWVLKTFTYKDSYDLIRSLDEKVIAPPEQYLKQFHTDDG